MSAPTENMPGWPELVRIVDTNNGAYKTTMLALRTIHGSARISERIVDEIADELRHRGLGFFPDPLPIRQEEEVVIFRQGSLGAELYMVMHDSARNGAQDALLRAIRVINESSETASRQAGQFLEELSHPHKRRRKEDNGG